MRATRTAAAALLGVTALLGLGAPAAAAKDAATAEVTPAKAAPGQSLTVTVRCEPRDQQTVTAHSQAFTDGAATLTAHPDDHTFTGQARLVPAQELAEHRHDRDGKPSAWGIDGQCPDGTHFTGRVTVEAPAPHGAMHTGLGGSVTTGSGLATGGALVAAGIGGFWLLRRKEKVAG